MSVLHVLCLLAQVVQLVKEHTHLVQGVVTSCLCLVFDSSTERPAWARPSRVPRHPLSRMELHCHDILGTTSWDVRGFSSCCTRFDTWARRQMVETAPAVAYGAPDMTHFLPPPAAPAVTNMGEAASVAPAPAVTYGAPPVVTSSGLYAFTYSLQPQVAPAVTYMGGCSTCSCAFCVLHRAASFTCRDLHE